MANNGRSYRIPGTEPPEPRQLAEHATVETRAVLALWIASGAIVVAGFAAFFTWQQVDIAREALKLAEKQTEANAKMVKAANAAFFDPAFVMSPREGYVDIGFQNTGKVLARDFSAILVVSRKRVPEYSDIGDPQTIRIEQSQIPPLKPSAGQTVALRGYGPDDLSRIEQMREVISVQGSFRYDNGFGDVVKQSVCVFYVDLHNPHGGGSSGFVPCEDAKSSFYLTPKR